MNTSKITEKDNGEQILPKVWLNWNTLSPDQMVEHLRKKYMFSSTGDAKCINYLIEFYNKYNEDNSHITEKHINALSNVVDEIKSECSVIDKDNFEEYYIEKNTIFILLSEILEKLKMKNYEN